MRMPTIVVLLLAAGCLVGASGCGDDDEGTPQTAGPGDEQATGAGGTDGGGEGGDGGDRGDGGDEGTDGDDEGEDVDDAGSDQAAIERSVATVATGGDPELVCEELATGRFVRSAYGTVEGCQDAVVAQRTVDVRVVDVVIDGSTARATAIPLAGPGEGERQKAELVLEDGVWKVDALRSNVPVGP